MTVIAEGTMVVIEAEEMISMCLVSRKAWHHCRLAKELVLAKSLLPYTRTNNKYTHWSLICRY